MKNIHKRPEAPDVKQGPINRRNAPKKSKKTVDIAPAVTVLSVIESAPALLPVISEPIVQEPPIMTDQIPTRTFQFEKTTKYGAVIYRCPGLGTATFTKTEFTGEPPAEVVISARFKSADALSESEREKLQKTKEKAMKQLQKKQEAIAAIDAKLKTVESAEPAAV